MSELMLMNRGLPKWPQMLVTGTPVTVEQAKEIIRRTDTFFTLGYDGNNREYNEWVRGLLKIPTPFYEIKGFYKLPFEEKDKINNEYAEKYKAFVNAWKPVQTSYVINSWVSCSFIGGPHGWCHPDGQIGFVDNVGKWPSIENIYNDWVVLLKEFPFLDIAVTLWDCESCEDKENANPVVSMVVRDEKVTLVDPFTCNIHENHPNASRRNDSQTDLINEFFTNLNNSRREQGVPDEWIIEWSKLVN